MREESREELGYLLVEVVGEDGVRISYVKEIPPGLDVKNLIRIQTPDGKVYRGFLVVKTNLIPTIDPKDLPILKDLIYFPDSQ